MRVQHSTFEFVKSIEFRNIWFMEMSIANHHKVDLPFLHLFIRQVFGCYHPFASIRKIVCFLHPIHHVFKLDKLFQIKMFSVQFQITFKVLMCHEVWEFFGDWEITITRHFLAGVDAAGVVQTGIALFWDVMVIPKSTDVIVLFETDGFKALVQGVLDGR